MPPSVDVADETNSVGTSASIPAALSAAIVGRRLFSHVQVQVVLSVQVDGTAVAALHVRQSSRAERKVERRDRKFELLHANRQQKRKEYKQRRKQHREQQREQRKDTQPTLAAPPAVKRGKLFREWTRSRQASAPIVCLDCQWESAMVETELQSLSKQLKFVYADNMHAQHPLRLALTSYGPDSAKEGMARMGDEEAAVGGSDSTEGARASHGPRLYTYMDRIEGFERWLIDRSPLHYTQRYAASSSTAAEPAVTYLTAESPNVLTRLQSDHVYVIGALVDHNRLPGMCHSAAVAAGVATARLPITECMRVETSRRTVITVNQVVECLLRWWNMALERGRAGDSSEQQQQQCSDDEEAWQLRWAAAFHKALPKRGGWQVREQWSAAISHADQQPQQPSTASNRQVEADTPVAIDTS